MKRQRPKRRRRPDRRRTTPTQLIIQGKMLDRIAGMLLKKEIQ